jgi:hypothetical protein
MDTKTEPESPLPLLKIVRRRTESDVLPVISRLGVGVGMQGVSQSEIARTLGVGRRTVRRWTMSGLFPERVGTRLVVRLDHSADYLTQRYERGCHNAAGRWRELDMRDSFFLQSSCAVGEATGVWCQVRDLHLPWRQMTHLSQFLFPNREFYLG